MELGDTFSAGIGPAVTDMMSCLPSRTGSEEGISMPLPFSLASCLAVRGTVAGVQWECVAKVLVCLSYSCSVKLRQYQFIYIILWHPKPLGNKEKRFPFATKGKKKFVSRGWCVLLGGNYMCLSYWSPLCLTGPLSHTAANAFEKRNFFFFPLSSGNPGPAQAENALSQNHLQLHKKSEKVSHPGQIAVGSSKSTDIFYVFIVFTEGMSMQIASLLVLEFAS